jgi:hypothetical protein
MIPKTRSECENGPRPCPYTTCKHHLLREYPNAKETCTLDVAARGEMSNNAIAELLGIQRRGVDTTLIRAVHKLPKNVIQYLLEGGR